MVKISGKLMPAQSLAIGGASSAAAPTAVGAQQNQSGRTALLNKLRTNIMQKNSRNIDIASI